MDRNSLGKNRGAVHEVTELLDVFRPITKWCHRVMGAEEIPATIEKALFETKNGRPRPVEVEIPSDVLRGKAEVKFSEGKQESGQTIDMVQVKQAAGFGYVQKLVIFQLAQNFF
ncbi:hypothetical protein ES703_79318 [subsurface metagenome]